MISTICARSTRQLNLALLSSNPDDGRVNGPHTAVTAITAAGLRQTIAPRTLCSSTQAIADVSKKSRQYLPALNGRTYSFLLELDDTCSVGIHPYLAVDPS